MSDSGSESEELNSPTSSCDFSASTDLSSDTMSESEDTDEDEQKQVNQKITDETCSNEEEEPLYKRSNISKVLSLVNCFPRGIVQDIFPVHLQDEKFHEAIFWFKGAN